MTRLTRRGVASAQVTVARPSEVDSLLPAPGASWVVVKADKPARESQQTEAPRRSLRAREERVYIDGGDSDEFDASEEESEEEEEGGDGEKEEGTAGGESRGARGVTPPPPPVPPALLPAPIAEPPPEPEPMVS